MKRPASVGETIGGYRLERLLGAGGMSQVFLGVHETLGRRVAIKLLSPERTEDETAKERFVNEARAVNSIGHPNITDIFDVIEDGDRLALVMEFVGGPDLQTTLAAGRPGYEQATGIALQLVAAVHAAHEAGVIHRDIKPANLLFTFAPADDTTVVPLLKVADFGVAKIAGPGSNVRTAAGATIGTPRYMAPEQVRRQQEPSRASDVFAVGTVLYEMLTGEPLYQGAVAEVVRAKLISEVPAVRLPEALPSRDEWFALITACIAPRPSDRPSLPAVRRRIAAVAPPTVVAAVQTILRASAQQGIEISGDAAKSQARTQPGAPPPGSERSDDTLVPEQEDDGPTELRTKPMHPAPSGPSQGDDGPTSVRTRPSGEVRAKPMRSPPEPAGARRVPIALLLALAVLAGGLAVVIASALEDAPAQPAATRGAPDPAPSPGASPRSTPIPDQPTAVPSGAAATTDRRRAVRRTADGGTRGSTGKTRPVRRDAGAIVDPDHLTPF